jgi:hypothetical protein
MYKAVSFSSHSSSADNKNAAMHHGSLRDKKVYLNTSSPNYRTIKRSVYPDLRTGQKFRVTYDSFIVGSKRKIRFVPEKKLRNQSNRERSGLAANFNVIA